MDAAFRIISGTCPERSGFIVALFWVVIGGCSGSMIVIASVDLCYLASVSGSVLYCIPRPPKSASLVLTDGVLVGTSYLSSILQILSLPIIHACIPSFCDVRSGGQRARYSFKLLARACAMVLTTGIGTYPEASDLECGVGWHGRQIEILRCSDDVPILCL